MPLPQANSDQKYTYADYLTWPDDERWEIIDGVAFPWNGIQAMSPAPSVHHQKISMELSRQLSTFLKGKPCQVFAAPFDVRLSDQSTVSDNYVDTVVQPDLVVVCNESKLDDRGCNGAPDLVIEITSPSTGNNDLTIKFDLYQKHCVKEYWIVLPEAKAVMVFRLQKNKKYGTPDRFGCTDIIKVPLLGDLMVELGSVFID